MKSLGATNDDLMTASTSVAIHHLRVIISRQVLEVLENREETSSLISSYPISSSKFGLGTEPGSYKTPLGKFFIAEKFGEGEPESMIFEARKATGMIAPLGGEQDYVLTRILWLSGLEPHNANTHDRFIYIHGTNQENLLGTPASHGCIRLRNTDIIELFDLVKESDRVEIV